MLNLAFFGQARELTVAVVLVAVLDEQIARRFPDTDADYVLAVFLQLQHESREVGVAGKQDERAYLGSSEHQLQSVDGEPDVGRILLVGSDGRSEDQVN